METHPFSSEHILQLNATSSRNNARSHHRNRNDHAIESRKNYSCDNQILIKDDACSSARTNTDEIIQLKYTSKRKSHSSLKSCMCSRLTCSNNVKHDALCKAHPTECNTQVLPTEKIIKTGDTALLINDIQKIDNEQEYEFTGAADATCTSNVCGSPEYNNWFLCTDNYDKSNSKSSSTLNSSQETTCSVRKRRRLHSPSSTIPSQLPTTSNIQSYISKTGHRLSIASIPPTVDINNPKKGDLIQMENGSRKKFDGVVWRKICSIPNCLIAAQRDELCRKHYIRINGKPNQASTNESLSKKESQTSQKVKDESMDYDEHSSINDNDVHLDDDIQINQENCSITSDNNIDTQIDHTLLNALSACRQKFLTNYMKNWLREHRHYPYPTNQEKLELAKQSHVTYDQVAIWFDNARAILQGRQEKKQHSRDGNSPNSDDDLSSPIQRSLPLFTGLCSRSIGIQCDTSTVNQTTSTSTSISTMTDEELLSDRSVKIIRPSSHSFQNNTSEDSLNNSNENEEFQKHQPIVITATCLDDDQMVRLKQFSSRFNIKLSNTVDEYTTHIITNEIDEKLVCPLSKKVIQAIARHLYVLTYRWIDSCLLMDKITDEKTFEIQGDSTISSNHHGMQRSRQSILASNLSNSLLFENFFIMLKCNGCQNLINNNELIELLKLTGAKYTTESYFPRVQTGLIRIVLCEKEYLINRKEIYEKCMHIGIHFLTPEWFLESIVQYRIQPFEDYQITP